MRKFEGYNIFIASELGYLNPDGWDCVGKSWNE